jgi:hypothetical protein
VPAIHPLEVSQDAVGIIGASVIDEDHVIPASCSSQHLAKLSVEFLDRLLFIIDGDDDRDIKLMGLVSFPVTGSPLGLDFRFAPRCTGLRSLRALLWLSWSLPTMESLAGVPFLYSRGLVWLFGCFG